MPSASRVPWRSHDPERVLERAAPHAAKAVARENARRLRLEGRVVFHHGDLLKPVAHLAGQINLVVSNPPYVDPADRDSLAPEVREHEPELAFSASSDGVSVCQRLLSAVATALKPGGSVALELGCGQAVAASAPAASAMLTVTRLLRDLQGIERILVARS